MVGSVDVIDAIFTPAVLERLAHVQRATPLEWDSFARPIRNRHQIICELDAKTEYEAALRRSWSMRIASAHAASLLDDSDVQGRLIGDDDEGFRGAMAECGAADFFGREMGYTIEPKPNGREGRVLDFRVKTPEILFNVEVKAPHVPQMNRGGSGNDARTLRKCIIKAGEQFADDVPNVAVIVPLLRTPIHYAHGRDQFVEAIIGQHALSVPVALRDGVVLPPAEPTFLQTGKLARLHDTHDGTSTDLTRISAVMTLEYELVEALSGPLFESRVFVIHNPFASHPVPSSTFKNAIQLVRRHDHLEWTDRTTPGREKGGHP